MKTRTNGQEMDANDIASSLLNMAAKVEEATAGFYLQASKYVEDREVERSLKELASAELSHEGFFSNLKSKYADRLKAAVHESTRRSIAKYARAFQDSRVFDFDFIFSQAISGKESTADVIQLAIGFEKDSIVFYTGLATIIEDDELDRLLKEIIREEFNHLSELSRIDYL